MILKQTSGISDHFLSIIDIAIEIDLVLSKTEEDFNILIAHESTVIR